MKLGLRLRLLAARALLKHSARHMEGARTESERQLWTLQNRQDRATCAILLWRLTGAKHWERFARRIWAEVDRQLDALEADA